MTTKIIRSRTRRTILNAGANRAARENMGAYSNYNETSSASVFIPTYVDPVPGRALATADLARGRGVEAEAVEARAEDVIDGETFDAALVNVDNPGAVARLIESAGMLRLPTLGHLVLQLPEGRVFGVRFALQAEEDERRHEAVVFFRGLQAITARSGSAALFGEGTRPSNTLVEPLLREAFAEHTRGALGRLAARIEPEHAPLDLHDGRRVLPLLVMERSTFGEPTEVVVRAAANPAVPLRRGLPFVVGEVTPAGIRLHEARLRQTDGRLDVRASTTIDENSIVAAQRSPSALSQALGEMSEAERHSLGLLFGGLLGGMAEAAGRALAGRSRTFETTRTDTLSSLSPALTSD